MINTDPMLELHRVSFGYGSHPILSHLSLRLHAGERVALVGPSGQGKSTVLRLIAGLAQPTQGTIALQGRIISSPGHCWPPEKRRVGLVFQDLALFPHLTVFNNIAFGLPQRGKSPTDKTRVKDLLQLFEMEDLADRRPDELSGGQKQRVAIARSLAPKPMLLMLDEPFANLDDALRQRLLERLLAVFDASSTTLLFVTHNLSEAQSLTHRVVQLADIQGTPREMV